MVLDEPKDVNILVSLAREETASYTSLSMRSNDCRTMSMYGMS